MNSNPRFSRIIPLLGMLLLPLNSTAQNIEAHVSPQGPALPRAEPAESNGAGLYNVDLYTGIANVSIPIYKFNVNNTNYDVQLNYSLQGLRVDEVASPVGLGWHLNAVGSLIRECRGVEDERILPSGERGRHYSSSEDADRWILSIGERTIKFTISTQPQLGEWEDIEGTVPKCNLKIKRSTGDVYEIEDEFFNVYTFWPGDQSVKNYTKKVYNIGTQQFVDSPYSYTSHDNWILASVKTNDDKWIAYTYQTLNVDYPANRNIHIDDGDGSSSPNIVRDDLEMYSGTNKFLSEIAYPNGTKVRFNYEPMCTNYTRYALSSIEVESGYEQSARNIIKYKFNYAYFNTIANDEVAYPYCSGSLISLTLNLSYLLRLKLKSIDRIGTDNLSTERYYTFEYVEGVALPMRVLSSQVDAFGYYNGKSPIPLSIGGNSHSLPIPQHTIPNSSVTYGLDRTPDPSYAKANLLQTVTNAGGASVTFHTKGHGSLATHNYQSYPSSDYGWEGENMADGLCIDKIVENDGFGNTTTTTYSFSNGENFWNGSFFVFRDGLSWKLIWSNNMTTSFETVRGAAHGYSNATVVKTGYNNVQLSKNEYEFFNIAYPQDIADDPAKTYVPANGTAVSYYFNLPGPITLNWPRSIRYHWPGLLKLAKTYDANNSLRSSLRYYYEYSPHTNSLMGHSWRPYKTVETLNRFNGTKVNTVELTYIDHLYDELESRKWTDSKGRERRKDYWYTNHEKTAEVENVKIGTNYHLIAFDWCGGSNFNLDNFHAPKLTQPLNLGSTARTWPVASGLLANADLMSKKYLLRDDKRNVLETYYPEQDAYSAHLWDTRLGEKLADVDNAKHDEVAFTSFEGIFQPYGTADYNKGQWDFHQSDVVLYGGSGLKPVTGKYRYHLSANRPVVSDIILKSGKRYKLTFWCSNPPQVTGASVESNNQIIQVGSWKLYSVILTGTGAKLTLSVSSTAVDMDELRLHPFDASMISYTYEPLFGPSSISNERNDIIYTEYDAQGRPRITRDIEGNILSKTDHVFQGSY